MFYMYSTIIFLFFIFYFLKCFIVFISLICFSIKFHFVGTVAIIVFPGKIWSCSGRSTQVPFWRKMSYWWFWSPYRSENILTTFWTIWPIPSGCHAEVKVGVKISKMLQVTFHVYQIVREVIRITKIYSFAMCRMYG